MERDHLAAFDFDPEVVSIASQPFWLFWENSAGKSRSHAPDYFLRRSDGSAMVVDCRPEDRRPARALEAFEATRTVFRARLSCPVDPPQNAPYS